MLPTYKSSERSLVKVGCGFFLGATCLELTRLLSFPRSYFFTDIDRATVSVFDTSTLQTGIALMVAILVAFGATALLRRSAVSKRQQRIAVRPIGDSKATTHNAKLEQLDSIESKFMALDQHTNEIRFFIGAYLAKNAKYSTTVLDANTQLNKATNLRAIREIVEHLVSKNEEAENDARHLRQRLHDSQIQISSLHTRLSTAEGLATIDALTLVANRREFERVLEHQISVAHEKKLPLCVIMADIDRFKNVNDLHGHQMGDDVLRSFSRLVTCNVRATDIVSRYGGEEFAIILPVSPTGDALQVAERIRSVTDAAILLDIETEKPLVRITSSFGVAELREGEGKRELIMRADKMLYQAKRNGRNRVEIESSSMKFNPPAPS